MESKFHFNLRSRSCPELLTTNDIRITVTLLVFSPSLSVCYLIPAFYLRQQGAASDLPIHYYSLSADLKDDWGNICEYQPAIHAYIKDLVTKHALGSHIAFNSKVVAAEWQTDLQAYKITIEDTRSGALTTSIAEVIISAHGLLHIPNMPPIPGLDNFKGLLFHSSQWDTSLDLRGKRVAVIGNGGSAYVIPFFFFCFLLSVTSESSFRSSATKKNKLVHKLSLTS